ncbi:hypothetical protein [Phytoactinopolyspora mesophila]|uniref:Uncharacterized protein n=1 Tax=Phytoactinopolyspora mesophila TaxID=2650750 RepID=A0A7K3M078_9ACTN|nr:hypothetical protein [Phytoactinopolyspora mesophila]NDL56701.1 hypothetical protein [Phytoactinopolyspora mesophila]
MKRWYILGPGAGAAVGLIAFAVGVQGWRPVLMGIVVAGVAVWAPRYWPEGAHLPWPRTANRLRSGGSSQVARLASRLGQQARSGRIPDPSLQHRLQRLAAVKMHRLGVVWDDVRGPELLGHDVHTVLRSESFQPDLPTIERIVRAIEQLDAAGGATAARNKPSHQRAGPE